MINFTLALLLLAFFVIALVVIFVIQKKFFTPKQLKIALLRDELEELIETRSDHIKLRYYFTPRDSVQWFNLPGLINTFKRVALSTDTLSVIDKREVQHNFGSDFKDVPFQRQRGEVFWFDFLADTGDGFDSTMNVFYPVTREKMKYKRGKEFITLNRADMLVIGGDLVYPDATENNYVDRFKGPLRLLYPGERENVRKGKERFARNNTLLLATPGNHDWYDGLNAFFRMMCQQKKIGSYQTIQQRSYFAFKLTTKVHLFGIDNQLMGDIDIPQLEYFVKTVREIAATNTKQYIILLIAEPNWYNYVWQDRKKRRQRMDSLFYLISDLKKTAKLSDLVAQYPDFQLEFKMVLCGDIHHYSHYEFFPKSAEEFIELQHLVTSGGGGAFGHLTDFLPKVVTIPDFDKREGGFVNYRLKTTYPTKKQSERQVRNNLIFPYYNFYFTLMLTGISYLTTYIFFHSASNLLEIMALLIVPASLTLIVYKVVAPERSKKEEWRDYFLHLTLFTASLLIQFFLLTEFQEHLKIIDLKTVSAIHDFYPDLLQSLQIDEFKANTLVNTETKHIVTILLSGILNAFLFGIYLFLSYRLYGKHLTEASSSSIQKKYRNFLKFKITDSQITVYTVGIEKCFGWKSLLRKQKPIDLQKQIYESNADPEAFLKKKFGSAYTNEQYKIIDEFSIELD